MWEFVITAVLCLSSLQLACQGRYTFPPIFDDLKLSMKKIWFSLIGVYMCTAYAAIPHVTLISDPKVLAIPIHENGDAWVNLSQQTRIAYGPSPEIPNNRDYIYLRQPVYEKLLQAQQRLPKGLHFCLYEGYRSLTLQKILFEKQYRHVQMRHPAWTAKQLFMETTKLVSPVVNPDKTKNIPPHSTGAAIDVYLIDTQGHPVEMGIHPKDWMQDKDGRLSLTDSADISDEAKRNRVMMAQALNHVGFVNYPTEYWHWSYGDRYWAFIKHEPHAMYSNTDRPPTK